MRVRDLVARLSSLPQDLEVVVDGLAAACTLVDAYPNVPEGPDRVCVLEVCPGLGVISPDADSDESVGRFEAMGRSMVSYAEHVRRARWCPEHGRQGCPHPFPTEDVRTDPELSAGYGDSMGRP